MWQHMSSKLTELYGTACTEGTIDKTLESVCKAINVFIQIHLQHNFIHFYTHTPIIDYSVAN